MKPIPTPNAQLKSLGIALSATAETAAMIELTEQAHARLATTTTGHRLLKLCPDFDEFAGEIANCIHGVASGEL